MLKRSNYSQYVLKLVFLNPAWSADSGQIVHFCISNQFGSILIPYFTEVNICHKSSFCLQITVTECILNLLDP